MVTISFSLPPYSSSYSQDTDSKSIKNRYLYIIEHGLIFEKTFFSIAIGTSKLEKYNCLCFFSRFEIEFWAPLLYNVVDSHCACTPVCLSVLHRPLSCDRRYINNPIGSKLLNYWKAFSCLLDPEGPETL
jgi:hypothetical protein